MRKEAKTALVPSSIMIALVVIGLLALVSKGPPIVYIYSGPSPLNNGALGTSQLVVLLRSLYPLTYAALSVDDVKKLVELNHAKHCVYVLISPSEPVSMGSAKAIISAIRRCPKAALLIADESTFSNSVLEVLGAQARIDGSILIDPSTKLPYPHALFRISGKVFELKLDIASSLSHCVNMVGWVNNPLVLMLSKRSAYVAHGRVCVAESEDVNGIRLIVIGDGSIFLNQVLESSNSSAYIEFIEALFGYLCGNDSRCLIIIDGMHYRKLNPLEALKNPKLFREVDPLTLIPALIAYVIHPAVWLPPALKFANNYLGELFTNPYLAPIAVAALTLISLAIVRRYIGGQRDYRLAEQYEVGAVIEQSINELLARGAKSFTKDDFRNLYRMVNEALEMFVGIDLRDPRCVDVLSKYVDRRKAENYVKKMNAYLSKAEGRSLLPIVISWTRVVRKMLIESESMLNAVGTSLERGVGAR